MPSPANNCVAQQFNLPCLWVIFDTFIRWSRYLDTTLAPPLYKFGQGLSYGETTFSKLVPPSGDVDVSSLHEQSSS